MNQYALPVKHDIVISQTEFPLYSSEVLKVNPASFSYTNIPELDKKKKTCDRGCCESRNRGDQIMLIRVMKLLLKWQVVIFCQRNHRQELALKFMFKEPLPLIVTVY